MPNTADFEDGVEVCFLLELARSLGQSGRHRQCCEAYEAAVRLDSTLAARNEYGCYLMNTDRPNEAINQFRAVLDRSLLSGNSRLAAMSCSNLAAAYRFTGQTEIAAAYQQRSLKWGAEADPVELSCDLSNRACDAMLAGEYDVAEQLLCRALLLDVRHDLAEGQAADWGNLGVLYGKRGQFRLGIRCLRQALRLHRTMKDWRGAGMDLLNLAELFEQSGQVPQAIRLLRRAVRHFERAHATRLLQFTKTILSDLMRHDRLMRHDPMLN